MLCGSLKISINNRLKGINAAGGGAGGNNHCEVWYSRTFVDETASYLTVMCDEKRLIPDELTHQNYGAFIYTDEINSGSEIACIYNYWIAGKHHRCFYHLAIYVDDLHGWAGGVVAADDVDRFVRRIWI